MKNIFWATITEETNEYSNSHAIPIEAENYTQAEKIAKQIARHWRTGGQKDKEHGGWTDGEMWWWLDGALQTEGYSRWVYTGKDTGYVAEVTLDKIKR
jgi:hypothetical protein